ncbi:hypothetical protein VYU27_008741 [Nannochloropsis oceanica]
MLPTHRFARVSSIITNIGSRRRYTFSFFRSSSVSPPSSTSFSSFSSHHQHHGHDHHQHHGHDHHQHHGHDQDEDDVRLIACVAPPNLTIGKGGQLPWDLPEDRKYFFHCTQGHVLVLGRRSYEEAGHALPGRETVVVSRTLSSLPDALVASSLTEALALAGKIKRRKGREGMITWIGGGHDLYQQTMALDRPSFLYLTQTHFEVQGGDAFFPEAWVESFPRLLWRYKSLSSPCTFGIYAAAARSLPEGLREAE